MKAGIGREGEGSTRKTRPPPARPPTRPEEAPAVVACWFVLANRAWRVGVRSVRRAAARVAILEANILRDIESF
jgi:hypothetical protein